MRNPIAGIGLLRGVYMPSGDQFRIHDQVDHGQGWRLAFRGTAVSQFQLAAPDREIAGSPSQ